MRKIIVISTLALLAGCNSEPTPSGRADGGGVSNSAPEAGAAKAGAAEEAQAKVVRRPGPAEVTPRLVGAWSRDTDCGRRLTFGADGALSAFDGAPGTWSVTGPSADGTMIRMEGEGRIANMEVTLIADDEVHLRDTDPGSGGGTLHLRRC